MFRPIGVPMDLNQRYIELNAIRQLRTLTRDERIEFEGLHNSREAAARDAQVLEAKAANDRLVREFQAQQQARAVEANWQAIFSTVIDGKLAVDNEANRKFILQWGDDHEPVSDIVQWFKDVVKSPIAKQQLAWTPYLTPAQKRERAESDERSLKAHFAAVCRDFGISECTANYAAWSSIADPLISELEGRKVVIDGEGNAIPLVSATPEEQQTWERQRFDQHQADLRRMQKQNDIQGLRRAAAQERNQYDPLAAARERQIKEVQRQYVEDQQRGYRQPLPKHFTQSLITSYKFDAKQMKEIMDRYGRARVSARIMGITEIPDPNGSGTISLE